MAVFGRLGGGLEGMEGGAEDNGLLERCEAVSDGVGEQVFSLVGREETTVT
jgi:hypothetical protein